MGILVMIDDKFVVERERKFCKEQKRQKFISQINQKKHTQTHRRL